MRTEHTEYSGTLQYGINVDTMTDMVIPPEMNQIHLDAEQLQTLGLRATWLRMCLARTAAVMTPRDRDVLTVVALSVHGVAEHDLLARLRDLTPGSAHAWLEHLCATWLSRRYVDDVPVIDLPEADQAWIQERLHGLQSALART